MSLDFLSATSIPSLSIMVIFVVISERGEFMFILTQTETDSLSVP